MSEPRWNLLRFGGNDLAHALLHDRVLAHADQASARPLRGVEGIRKAMVATELCDHGRDRRSVLARPQRPGLLRDDARAGLAIPRGRRGLDGPSASGRGLAALVCGVLLRAHADQPRLFHRPVSRAESGERGSWRAERHQRHNRGVDFEVDGHSAPYCIPAGDPGDSDQLAGRRGGGLRRRTSSRTTVGACSLAFRSCCRCSPS